MKLKSWTMNVALALTMCATDLIGAPLQPRTDINPAVLYWQGFSLYPELKDEIRKEFLATPPTLPLEDAEPVIKQFDGMMKCVKRAAQMKMPCDWGIDLSDGPEALIPNLIKIRKCSQASVARAHYLLDSGREQQAGEELGTIVVLGRNAGKDGTLVGTMIGIAVEGLINDFVAKNFYRFTPPALLAFRAIVDNAPRAHTVKQAMGVERAAFLEWFINKFEEIQLANTDKTVAMEKARALLTSNLERDDEQVDKIFADAGNTVSGLVSSFRSLEPIYQLMQETASVPPDKLKESSSQLRSLIQTHTNTIAQLIIPNLERARAREMEHIARTAMVRAAIALRLEGEDGFQKVKDPFGTGPLVLRRLPTDSGEVGFELDTRLSEVRTNVSVKFFEDKPVKPSKR